MRRERRDQPDGDNGDGAGNLQTAEASAAVAEMRARVAQRAAQHQELLAAYEESPPVCGPLHQCCPCGMLPCFWRTEVCSPDNAGENSIYCCIGFCGSVCECYLGAYLCDRGSCLQPCGCRRATRPPRPDRLPHHSWYKTARFVDDCRKAPRAFLCCCSHCSHASEDETYGRWGRLQ